MSTGDPKPICTCPRIDAAQFGLYGEGHHYVPGRPDPNCHFHGGSTPVSEEPAPAMEWHYGPAATDPEPGKMWHYGCGREVMVFKDGAAICECGASDREPVGSARLSEEPAPGAERLVADLASVERLATWLHENFRPLAGDVLIFDDCLEIARHAVGTLKCDERAAYARGISEGRRQAAREIYQGIEERDAQVPHEWDEAHNAYVDAMDVARSLVGPRVPAEQPESRVRTGYQCAIGGEACPGHSSKWLMCDPATCTAGEVKIRPRMTDGCGPEHTYRDGCELREANRA